MNVRGFMESAKIWKNAMRYSRSVGYLYIIGYGMKEQNSFTFSRTNKRYQFLNLKINYEMGARE